MHKKITRIISILIIILFTYCLTNNVFAISDIVRIIGCNVFAIEINRIEAEGASPRKHIK